MKKRYAILVAILPLCQAVFAQANRDSLWRVWQNAALQDTTRLAAIQELAYGYIHNAPDSALAISELQLAFARKKELPVWEAKALNNIGLSYRFQSDYEKALQHYEQSLALSEAAGDRRLMSAVYGNMGDLYRVQSNFPKAIDCIRKSLSLAEETGDKKRQADSYIGIATIYYEDSEDTNKGLEYLEKARVLYEELKNVRGLSLVYGNLSAIYLDKNDLEKALVFTEKSYAALEKLGDKHSAASALFNRAVILGELGRYGEAMADYERVVAVFRQMGDQEGLADAYNGMGDLCIQQQHYPSAIKLCGDALKIAREMGSPNTKEVEACLCLYIAHQGLGNYQKALYYLEQQTIAKDSLQQNETAEKLKQMEIERQTVADSLHREKERFELEMGHQKTIRRKDRTMAVLAVVGLVVLAVALAFLGRMLYFQRRSQQLQAHSDELEKQQLISEIALLRSQVNPHFLFNSLSILSSLVHVDANLSEQFIEQLSRSYRYILEQKEQSLVTLRTELEFIKSYAFLLKIRFENKFNLEITLPDELLDSKKIAPLTLQLLIENAVKHNRMSVKSPLVITISADDKHTLVVKNRLQPRSSAVVSTGVGLQNIINRYALLTKCQVWAGETESEFVVKVPLLN